MSINYKEFLEKLEQDNQLTGVCIFKGSVDKTTGQNWCSDCVKAEPNIKNYIESHCEKNNIQLFKIEVGDKDEWKNKEHLLRKHKKLQLKGVPTVLYLKNGYPLQKMKEEDLFNENLVKQFVNGLQQFIS